MFSSIILDSYRYGQNVSSQSWHIKALSPNIMYLKVSLWEITLFRWDHEGEPLGGINAHLKKEVTGSFLSTIPVRTQQEGDYLQARKRVLTRN